MLPKVSPDDVVICGLSGRFPKSNDVNELWDNLTNGVDMSSDDESRWDRESWNVPHRMGIVSDFEYFDSQFFGMSKNEAKVTDPQERTLLEVTYEAMIDAGFDPRSDLMDTTTCLFKGDCFKQPNTLLIETGPEPYKPENLATRIMVTFGLKGSVSHVDTACASSFCALNECFHNLRSNLCDIAIVTGSNTCFNPYMSLQARDLNMISPAGTSRPLDSRADGYMRSEAAVAVIVTKRKFAKRIYATILNSWGNTDGYTEEGITFPSGQRQEQLMVETFKAIDLDPKDVQYIESHATGTAAGDPVEANAICSVFCPPERSCPLLVGCLKSNLGHTEGAAGLVALAKSLLCFQNNSIPPNINFKNPNPAIDGIKSGQLVPVLEVTPFHGDIISLNCFGFGGANNHAVIRRESSVQSIKSGQMTFPRLVLAHGRTANAVRHLLDTISGNQKYQNDGILHLVDKFVQVADEFPFRGFMVMKSDLDFDTSDIVEVTGGHYDSVIEFDGEVTCETLMAIGQLFLKGFQISLERLYQKSSGTLPLGSSTPSLSPLLKWNHEYKWPIEVSIPTSGRTQYTSQYKDIVFRFDPKDSEATFYADHQIDSRKLFPAAGLLAMAWAAFCRVTNHKVTTTPIEFTNVQFIRATIFGTNKELAFKVRINEDSGHFEIKEREVLIMSGSIHKVPNLSSWSPPDNVHVHGGGDIKLSSSDVYKELRVRGYDYGKCFQGLHEVCIKSGSGSLVWDLGQHQNLVINFRPITEAGQGHNSDITDKNDLLWLRSWITFVDSMMQFKLIMDTSSKSDLQVPTSIRSLQVDPLELLNHVHGHPEKQLAKDVFILECIKEPFEDTFRTFGLKMIDMKTSPLKRFFEPVLTMAWQKNLMTEELVVKHHGGDIGGGDNGHTDIDWLPDRVLKPIFDLMVLNNVTTKGTLTVTQVLAGKSDLMAENGFEAKFQEYTRRGVYSDLFNLDFDTCSNNSSVRISDVIICHDLPPAMVKNVQDSVTDHGFVILCTETKRDLKFDTCVTILEKVLVVNDQSLHFQVLRKIGHRDASKDMVIKCPILDYSWTDNVRRCLMSNHGKKDFRLWLKADVQTGDMSGLVGFVKSIRFEDGGQNVRCVIDPRFENFDLKLNEYQKIIEQDLAINIWDIKLGGWVTMDSFFTDTPELEKSRTRRIPNDVFLRAKNPGDLSSLTWTESPLDGQSIKSGLKTIRVHYAAINFKDIMFASGQLPPELFVSTTSSVDTILGMEFSGHDENGDRVYGAVDSQALSTVVQICDPEYPFLFKVPKSWTMADAATVPIVYLTAIYALEINGKVAKGETILIHAASGGVGLAAINICVHRQLEIFATVSNGDKKDFLLATFPTLKAQNIFNSRNGDFEEQVLRATGGHGVDVLLNCLSGNLLQASLRCLSPNGRFLEIGKSDLVKNSTFDTITFSDNRSFFGICLDQLYHRSEDKLYKYQKKELDKLQLRELFLKGIKDGYVKPLKATIFGLEDTIDAFKFMAGARHVGKVLIQIRDGDNDFKCLQKSRFADMITSGTLAVDTRTYFNPDKSYIVVGGLGGLGLQVVKWMVTRGARKIIVSSRSGLKEPFQKFVIDKLAENCPDLVLKVSRNDAMSESSAMRLIDEATKLGTVGGIINSAAALHDCLFMDMTGDMFETVAASKARTGYFLDKVSRQQCPQLDHFVCFSSISNARGNAGQTNYNFGNCVLDNICTKRQSDNLPGLSIQWGVIGDVGLVIDRGGFNGTILLSSKTQRISSCLEFLDKFMSNLSPPVVMAYVKTDSVGAEDGDSSSLDLLQVINRLLGFKNSQNIDQNSSLGSLGIDSLMAVELTQMLDQVKGVQASMKSIREMTLKQFICLASADH